MITLLVLTSAFVLLLCVVGWVAERGVFDGLITWLEGDQ